MSNLLHGMFLVRTESNLVIGFSALRTVAVFCLALAIDAAMGLYRCKALIHGCLIHPDSYMRLVRLDEPCVAGIGIAIAITRGLRGRAALARCVRAGPP